MAAINKNVVFDCVGTLVGYEKLSEAIDARMGDRLRAEGIKPILFGYTWIEVAEREYTYLSMSGKYVTFADTFAALFWRILFKAGVQEPRRFADEGDLAAIMEGYKAMELRPGAKECFEKLRNAGFTVWGFTMGDSERVGGYFKNAGVELPAENLLSCDSSAIGKPDPAAYRPLLERLKSLGGTPWFAAAHLWDASAAKRTGFRGAYCSVYEGEALTDLFGEMDVLSDSLPEMADKIIAASR
ncbi:related to 2-haloalkanoic acid dehalogenase [Lecanosticta acicola]|uniref:Related to 2-haloalkanoic acid dehalogenase n=1 Tax=Lecanosticta acicola TaxID=111012 RepID=A0AAI8YTR9_9PEZI|nr:related to 2-haloalkanoic acid dehalogenase [Lecanosticta acicola]